MPDPLKNLYERYLREQGLVLPSPEDFRRQYHQTIAGLFTPSEAIVLGADLETGDPFYFLPEHLLTGLHIPGWTGRGKTTACKLIFRWHLDHYDRRGEGCAVIDPHGPLALYALDQCARLGPSFAERVVYVSLADLFGKIPIFNPFAIPQATEGSRLEEAHAREVAATFAETIVKVFGSERTTDQPQASEVLEHAAAVLAKCRLTPLELAFFVYQRDDDRRVRDRLVERASLESAARFFSEIDEFPLLDRNRYFQTARRRADYFTKSIALKHMTGQTLPGLDFRQLMDEGYIVIFNLGLQGAGASLELQTLAASLVIQEFRKAALHRVPDCSRPFTLIADEFGSYTSSEAMRVIVEARKFGLRSVWAHHHLGQLIGRDGDARLYDTVLGIENKLIFGGGPKESTYTLAEQVYSDWVDLKKRKLEIRTDTFEPVPKLVMLMSRTFSSSRAGGGDPGESESVTSSPPEFLRPGEPRAVTRTTHQPADERWGETESTTEHEQYVTMYQKYQQLSSVQFESADEQIFAFHQLLHRAPTGHAAGVRRLEKPRLIAVTDENPDPLPDEELRAYLERDVYRSPRCLTHDEAETHIRDRHEALRRETLPPGQSDPKTRKRPSR